MHLFRVRRRFFGSEWKHKIFGWTTHYVHKSCLFVWWPEARSKQACVCKHNLSHSQNIGWIGDDADDDDEKTALMHDTDSFNSTVTLLKRQFHFRNRMWAWICAARERASVMCVKWMMEIKVNGIRNRTTYFISRKWGEPQTGELRFGQCAHMRMALNRCGNP